MKKIKYTFNDFLQQYLENNAFYMEFFVLKMLILSNVWYWLELNQIKWSNLQSQKS